MTTLNRSSITTIAIIRFEHLSLAWLERYLSNSWHDIQRGKPEKAYGVLSFTIEDESGSALTAAVVSEWFVELRSRKEDPMDIFSRLIESLLTEPTIVPVGLTIEMVAVLDAQTKERPDMVAILNKPFEDMLQPFSQATHSKVEAVGMRLFLQHNSDGNDGYYTFDISPAIDSPDRQLFLRLKSRRSSARGTSNEVTCERFKKLLTADRAFLDTLVINTSSLLAT